VVLYNINTDIFPLLLAIIRICCVVAKHTVMLCSLVSRDISRDLCVYMAIDYNSCIVCVILPSLYSSTVPILTSILGIYVRLLI
jgi:hypothetical protein